MKTTWMSALALSLFVLGCASGSTAPQPNTPQQATCVSNKECGSDQSCQKEPNAATGVCMAAAAQSNGPQKATCLGSAECGVGQICKKDPGALSGTCAMP